MTYITLHTLQAIEVMEGPQTVLFVPQVTPVQMLLPLSL